ncbi:hypothetical protein PpBr36_04646 [Pyricularia pennisetigena]|uniref:hypothetical protein n=1 Tax=Pyricularia pennisetigena TaxID=1578925 RepID=UPI001152D002|nr:hypothetical protein PpBr36_04646 [Pyricularia pennisetigena]TLS27651.1 hypothetical protein PpBr36_04646 [Pyricularia pennisetigena]
MVFYISRKSKIIIVLSISALYFIAELHDTERLAQINDVISFTIGLVAVVLSEQKETPPEMLSFGWQRATILGSFFNGVFLLALGLSIFLHSIERFVSPERSLYHTHSSCFKRQLFADDLYVQSIMSMAAGILTVTYTASNMNMRMSWLRTIHGTLCMHTILMPDTGITFKLPWPKDTLMILGWPECCFTWFYADPAVSTFIAIMIFITAIPLVRKSGEILLQSVPAGLSPSDVAHDLEKVSFETIYSPPPHLAP